MVRAVGKTHGRPQHPSLAFDLAFDDGISVVRLREKTSKLLFWIILEHRKDQLAFIGGDDRAVVSDEFRKQRQNEQRHEDNEGKESPAVRFKIFQSPLINGRKSNRRVRSDWLTSGV